MFDVSKIDDYFPWDKYRDGQRDSIKFVLDSWNDGKKIVILEAPTGAGKSVIGYTIASMVQQSYYLSVTKILQDQLVRDFKDMVELKGKNAYPCTWWNTVGPQRVEAGMMKQQELDRRLALRPSCNEGFCRTNRKSSTCEDCFLASSGKGVLNVLPPGKSYSACPYYEQVESAKRSSKVVMNFHSFIYQTNYTDRFGVRDVMIVDECHAAEQVLLDFVSISLNDLKLRNYGIKIPHFRDFNQYAVWYADENVGNKLTAAASHAGSEGDIMAEDEFNRLKEKFDLFLQNVSEDEDCEWIVEYESKNGYNALNMKPVFVRKFAHNLLFSKAKFVLMMSATVLNTNVLCGSLGIPKSQVAAKRMISRFPVENRPIYYKPVANITGGKAGQERWGDALVKGVESIVKKYEGKRGIIHTHNFQIASLLMESCSKKVRDRFYYQENFRNKGDMLLAHSESEDGVIVAPAMHEGINLVDDLSRFQIICKVPYPNFYDDKQLARRMEMDKSYVPWLTALKIVQAVGRSVRSETDYADTYIIDGAFDNFLKYNKSMLPSWFTEALKT